MMLSKCMLENCNMSESIGSNEILDIQDKVSEQPDEIREDILKSVPCVPASARDTLTKLLVDNYDKVLAQSSGRKILYPELLFKDNLLTKEKSLFHYSLTYNSWMIFRTPFYESLMTFFSKELHEDKAIEIRLNREGIIDSELYASMSEYVSALKLYFFSQYFGLSNIVVIQEM